MRRALMALPIFVFFSNAHAAIQTRTVDYKQGDTTLKGYLAWDDASDAKRPGIMVIHEWWGLNDYVKHRAEQLAQLGYVAFAADIYGEGKTTTDPQQAGQWSGQFRQDPALAQARLQAGLDQLKSQKQVDGEQLAAMGYCFGGTMSLHLAFSGAPLKGVVSFHGGLAGLPLGEVGKVKGEVLICNGAADTMVKTQDAEALQSALEKANVKWTFVNYSGAKHAFTNPQADQFGLPGIAYNQRADQQSWQHMRSFFESIFARRAGAGQ